MEVKTKKTARFDVLVKQSGGAEQVTLWTKPEDDRDFMKAVNAERVVIVFQHNVGTKKDFGVVGFSPKKNAAFLVFPKTLDPDEGTQVVGIKYERVQSESTERADLQIKKTSTPGNQNARASEVSLKRPVVPAHNAPAEPPIAFASSH